MLSNMRFLSLMVIIMSLLVSCTSPTATATTSAAMPTSTSLPPTESIVAATSTPGISGTPISIPVEDGSETFDAEVIGNGEVAIILGHGINDASGLVPLVEALSNNGNVRIVTFVYRDVEATVSEDTRAVFDYLRAQGLNRIICIAYGFGQTCGALQNEPEIIGMVFYDSAFVPAIEADFPKLFLASDPGSTFVTVGQIQREYDQAAEPKSFKSYESGKFGLGVFTDPIAGPQLLADVTDFIKRIANGR